MKETLKILLSVVAFLVASIGLYLGLAYILSHLGVPAETESGKDVSVYILTNGVHTDIVVPIKNDIKSWSDEIKFDCTRKKDTTFNFVALGWGDKGFYLDTPTWADLTARTAFRAAFSLSTSAIHATFYKSMKEGKDCVRVNLSRKQYLRLVKYIENSFQYNKQKHFINIRTNANYGNNDAFYEATGSYSLCHTCNTWANNALKSCGQRACWWTPFDTGIFYQYNQR